MENGPPTIGFEDGIVDVERLLEEPQDGNVSVDSVMRFSEKMPEKAMDISEVSCSFGVTSTGIADEGGDILNRDVLDSLHTEDDGGYFRLQNDFCNMGEEYLLGVGFTESITDLEYVSSVCLQTSVADGPALTCAGIDSPWKTDLFRIMDVPECQNDEACLKNSDFCEIPCPHHESENLAEKKPLKSPDGNINKVTDISSCSFDDIPSDENSTRLSEPVEIPLCPKNEKSDECRQICQIGETKRFQGQHALTLLSNESQSDALPTLKRSRKPTKRYIDEVTDPILRHSKRKREVSSSSFRDKSVGVKDHKKCHIGSKSVRLPAEESAVKAIQVPFGSLVHKECAESPAYNMLRSSDRRNLMDKPKDNVVASENQKKRDEFTLVVHQMKRSDGIPAASQKKDDNVSRAQSTKSDQCTPTIHFTRRNDSVMAASHKKKEKDAIGSHVMKSDDHLTAVCRKTREYAPIVVSPKKKDECATVICQKKRDHYSPTADSPEDVGVRRKHHRLWTVAEVKKLIDGVSDYGVGRWSRIKKVFFSASAHRTSVDLKDKWRNLLKASDLQGQHNQQGEKRRNVAWRPLPKSILRRVCELAVMHPYPKDGKAKIAHIRRVSPDRSTDITLSDYRRILRSINGN